MKRLYFAAGALLLATSARDDEPLQPRTWEELKAETQAWAERGAYPVFHFNPKDIREALNRTPSLDRLAGDFPGCCGQNSRPIKRSRE
jgi:hypothetical protein